jgi:hypothetical protein
MVEISGQGTIMMDGYPVENHTVLYWLDICEEPGDLFAEGSIHGSEGLMRSRRQSGPYLNLKQDRHLL